MALERAGAILGRLTLPRGRALPTSLAPEWDGEGYRMDCCDACPVLGIDRRAIVAHRVRCDIFEATVIEPMREGWDA